MGEAVLGTLLSPAAVAVSTTVTTTPRTAASTTDGQLQMGGRLSAWRQWGWRAISGGAGAAAAAGATDAAAETESAMVAMITPVAAAAAAAATFTFAADSRPGLAQPGNVNPMLADGGLRARVCSMEKHRGTSSDGCSRLTAASGVDGHHRGAVGVTVIGDDAVSVGLGAAAAHGVPLTSLAGLLTAATADAAGSCTRRRPSESVH